MSTYLRAGELFRQREQLQHKIVKFNREFHAANSEQQDKMAAQQSELGAQTVTIGRELHELGFRVRVENVAGLDVFHLVDRSDDQELSSFEVHR